jgi:hypothetical protein
MSHLQASYFGRGRGAEGDMCLDAGRLSAFRALSPASAQLLEGAWRWAQPEGGGFDRVGHSSWFRAVSDLGPVSHISADRTESSLCGNSLNSYACQPAVATFLAKFAGAGGLIAGI